MEAEPFLPEQKNTSPTFEIPRSPESFHDGSVYQAVLQEVMRVRSGDHPNKTCKCSYYPLANSIAMALRGELFAGINGNSSPEVVARKITDLLFAEVVRIDALKKTAGLKAAA